MLVVVKIVKKIIEDNIFWNLGDEDKINGCAFFQILFFLDELEGCPDSPSIYLPGL